MLRRTTTTSFKRVVKCFPKASRNFSVAHHKSSRRIVSRQASPLVFKNFYATVPEPMVLEFPALSPTMESGKIAKWVKKEGDKVSMGDLIAEVETDKTTVGWESTEDGWIAKILVQPGAVIQVNQPALILVENKDQIESGKNFTPGAPAPPKAAPPPTPASPPPPPPAAKPAPAAASSPKVPRPPVLTMPALSPTMDAGKVAKWLKKEGDVVNTGDAIAEIETDKTTVTMDTNEEGIIAKILVGLGVSVNVGDPIAILVENAADVPKYKDYTLEMVMSSGSPAASAPAASSPSTSAPPTTTTTASSTPAPSTPSGGRIIASPLAKATAAQKGIDLAQLQGTGPNGRIIKADVDEFTPVVAQAPAKAEPVKAAPATKAAPVAAPPSIADYEDLPNSSIRQITAERLTYSKQNIPHYYLTIEVNVDKVMQLREQLNSFGKGDNGFKLSMNDFVVKASALALRAVPQVNSEWRGDSIRRYNSVHINVAVNTPTGLYTPIVRDADKLGLKTINTTVKELAQRANSGKPALADLQMGTFTISNLGMFGISSFSAVINPPQAAILAVGGTKKVVVPKTSKDIEGEAFEVANVMSVTLSCDHRVVDGAIGAQWLQTFKDLMENPMKFML